MAFYDIFERLCGDKGATPTQVARDNGLTQQTVSHWKTRGSTPKAETVQRLADYFGVSVNYLLGLESERVIIPGRLKIVEIDDPESGLFRYDIEAADEEALNYAYQILGRAGVSAQTHSPQALVLAAMEKLNHDGQQKAVDRVQELTEIPRYRAQQAPQSTPAPQEGTGTASPTDTPQWPQEGK